MGETRLGLSWTDEHRLHLDVDEVRGKHEGLGANKARLGEEDAYREGRGSRKVRLLSLKKQRSPVRKPKIVQELKIIRFALEHWVKEYL